MKSILDHFLHRQQPFRPKSIAEVLALRVSQGIHDEAAAAHYASLVAEHSPERLLGAYRRVLKGGSSSDLASRFHKELQHETCRVSLHDDVRLIAVKVERRSVAAAVFIGLHLEHTDIRHLSSQPKRAESSAVDFIQRIVSTFHVESAAIESVPTTKKIRRAALSTAIIESCLLSRELSLWPFLKTQLLRGFGYPALRSRKELREVILSMWPVLNDTPNLDQALDAVALGALVQVERLFLP